MNIVQKSALVIGAVGMVGEGDVVRLPELLGGLRVERG